MRIGFRPDGRRTIAGGSVILPSKPLLERPREFFLKQSPDARLILPQPLIHLRGDPDRRGIAGIAGFHLDRQIIGFGPDGRRKSFWMTTRKLLREHGRRCDLNQAGHDGLQDHPPRCEVRMGISQEHDQTVRVPPELRVIPLRRHTHETFSFR
jgi:hypothetical protein